MLRLQQCAAPRQTTGISTSFNQTKWCRDTEVPQLAGVHEICLVLREKAAVPSQPSYSLNFMDKLPVLHRTCLSRTYSTAVGTARKAPHSGRHVMTNLCQRLERCVVLLCCCSP